MKPAAIRFSGKAPRWRAQWSLFNSRNNAGGQPARSTQLDYDHQRADLFKGN
jgi:hypothetical protein